MRTRTRRISGLACRVAAAGAWAGASLGVGACASSRGEARTLDVAPGEYAAAFDATREVLRSHRFTLERVDARTGVITTEPRFGVGMLNPLDRTQSTLGQEVTETLNQEGRRVRVVFSRRERGADGQERSGTAWEESGKAAFGGPGTEGKIAAAGEAEGVGDNGENEEGARTPGALADARRMLDGSVRPTLEEDLREAGGPLVMKVEVVVDRVVRPGKRIETSSIRHSSYAIDPSLFPRGMLPTYTVARERDDRFAARVAAEVRKRMGESGR